MFNKIRAIHLAVHSVDEAAEAYEKNFGLKRFNEGTLPELGIKNAFVQVGEAVIEFIEPLDPGKGPLTKFLKKRGEGVYMTAFEVENIDTAIEELKSRGVPLINDDPETRATGVPVYIHPKAANGLFIELIEKSEA